jgi:hypothetical protein
MLSWSKEGKLIISNMNDNAKPELYANSVSDIEAERDKKRLMVNDLSNKGIKSLGWEFNENAALHGGLTPIRVVSKSEDGFYSDMKAILYAPLDKGHVLMADMDNPQATLPFSYLQNQYLTRRDPNKVVNEAEGITNFPKFTKDANGKHNGVNGGIQLNIITEVIKGKGILDENIKMAYYPEGETEGAKGLEGTGFGGSRVMYLRVNTGATGREAIASITYLPGYEGKMFYISFNGKLYQGRFANNDNFSNDGSAYNLEGAELMPNTFIGATTPNQVTVGDTSGREVKSGDIIQPIYVRPYAAVDGNLGGEEEKEEEKKE